jgi:hypothetical protein
MYFNEKTAEAISKYQSCENPREREKLYNDEILPAFTKLVENLIHIHGFKGSADLSENLQNDCVTFLFEVIHKFDASRGTKPFSYFNVVAKHWLIIRSKQRLNKIKKNVSISDEGMSTTDREKVEKYQMLPSPEETFESLEFIDRVHGMLDVIKERLVLENELKCIEAIQHLFAVSSDTDDRPGEDLLLNKRAVFVYLRELSGLQPKELSGALAVIKRHYKELRLDSEKGLY